MHNVLWVVVGLVMVIGFKSASATVIPLSDSPKVQAHLASMGVQVVPTGPLSQNVWPTWSGAASLGFIAAALESPTALHDYDGRATFGNPVSQVTFDVSRGAGLGWDNEFVVRAFDDKKLVLTRAVELLSPGDVTHITIKGPAIDKVVWNGLNPSYLPYTLQGIEVNFATPQAVSGVPAPNSAGSTVVGSAAPEPGTLVLLSAAAGLMLPSRRWGRGPSAAR